MNGVQDYLNDHYLFWYVPTYMCKFDIVFQNIALNGYAIETDLFYKTIRVMGVLLLL